MDLTRCSNGTCPNRPTGGLTAATAQLGKGDIVGGHRPLILVFCSPCAEAFQAYLPVGLFEFEVIKLGVREA